MVRRTGAQFYPQIVENRLRPLDGIRYLIQTTWLVTVHPDKLRFSKIKNVIKKTAHLKVRLMDQIYETITIAVDVTKGRLSGKKESRIVEVLVLVLAVALSAICIMQPFNVAGQFVFSILLFLFVCVLRFIPGRSVSLLMICISLLISCRYMWWRYTATLNWDDPLSVVCGCFLLVAETYSWVILLLGYFQVSWPLHRQPEPLPNDQNLFPEVDIFIVTYDEPLSIVQSTVFGALGIDWPQDKLTVWLLDDGRREEFRLFSKQVGIRYLARETHDHAKAGNVNHALTHAKGRFVAIFDCDHIPARAFLQMTMGLFFKDPKLALVQTPHHFFSPDPFERNLKNFGELPNESKLFYGLIQDGNDTWNATFFCGSCAVISRSALDEIGGIAMETVTEDAHTSLRLHRHGYNSAYIRIPLATGLATESLSSHIGQRLRWARGMTQIFRLDNPFLGRGLTLAQRLCYASAMLHFLFGIPRLIFFLAPLAFLLLHAYIIYAPAVMILLFVLPYMMHVSLTNSRIHGQFRHSFWGEIYEAVMSWYVAWPTFLTLFMPNKGIFNVTSKGKTLESSYMDWTISRPYLLLIGLNGAGVIAGCWRLYAGEAAEWQTVIVSLLWVLYNLLILGGAVAVAAESRQLRRWQRVPVEMSGAIMCSDGHLFPAKITDYSDESAGLQVTDCHYFNKGDAVQVLITRGSKETCFEGRVIRVSDDSIGVRFRFKTIKKRIEYMRYTFGRADTWSVWDQSIREDKLLRSLVEVTVIGVRGYVYLGESMPKPVRVVFKIMGNFCRWIWSFTPRNPAYLAFQSVEVKSELKS